MSTCITQELLDSSIYIISWVSILGVPALLEARARRSQPGSQNQRGLRCSHNDDAPEPAERNPARLATDEPIDVLSPPSGNNGLVPFQLHAARIAFQITSNMPISAFYCKNWLRQMCLPCLAGSFIKCESCLFQFSCFLLISMAAFERGSACRAFSH
jgi:hypothetical protein